MRALKAAALTAVAPFVGAIAQPDDNVGTHKISVEVANGSELITDFTDIIEFHHHVGGRCGTPIPLNAGIIQQHLDSISAFGPSIEGGIISTVVHVMCADDGSDCAATQQMVDDQMNTLNEAFADTGYGFFHVDTVYTTNSTWLDDIVGSGSAVGDAMKTALAVDPATTFNVYVTDLKENDSDSTLLGYATFPFEYPEDDPRHGVVLNGGTLPGGSLNNTNLGITLVHETGHYLGLYHTFQGESCDGPGDFIDDTPAEASEASGCPVGRDTCPDHPGLDPINNFMDYSDDACMSSFTEGQRIQMNKMVSAFKPNLVTTVPELVVLSNLANPGVCTVAQEFGCTNNANGTAGNPQDIVNCFMNDQTAIPYQVHAIRFWLASKIPAPEYLEVRIWSGSKDTGPSSSSPLYHQSLPDGSLMLMEGQPVTAYLDNPIEITEQEFCAGIFSGATTDGGLTNDAVKIQAEIFDAPETFFFQKAPWCDIDIFEQIDGAVGCIELLVKEAVSCLLLSFV
jgi:hypothetical protein